MAEKEYIEREKLNDMLEDFCVNESFYDALQTIPSADVSTVRHGRWEATRETNIWGDKVGVLRCSMCNRFKSHGKAITVPYDFCPNCGAKMDGGEGE